MATKTVRAEKGVVKRLRIWCIENEEPMPPIVTEALLWAMERRGIECPDAPKPDAAKPAA